MQYYIAVQGVVAGCFARVELLQDRQYFLFREFVIIGCEQRFQQLVTDTFMMYPVAIHTVFRYKMIHQTVDCALHVSCVGIVAGFES